MPRISKVTTRGGDKGQTKLATGRRVAKHDPIMVALGGVDELNSQIGLLTTDLAPQHATVLKSIQQSLFDMGAVFAMEGEYVAPEAVALEAQVDALNSKLPPLTEFVLPGGGKSAAQAHVCRSVCRRAERDLWALVEQTEAAPSSYTTCARYLNRLSDYLFVLARTLTEKKEEQWRGPEKL